MASQGRGSMTAAASLLAGFLVTACIGRPQSPRADPAKGFDPNAAAEKPSIGNPAATAPVILARTIPARNMILLPQHGILPGWLRRDRSTSGLWPWSRSHRTHLRKNRRALARGRSAGLGRKGRKCV